MSTELPSVSVTSIIPSAASAASVITSVMRPWEASDSSGNELNVTPGMGNSLPFVVAALALMPSNDTPLNSSQGIETFLRKRYLMSIPASSTCVCVFSTHMMKITGKMRTQPR